MTTRRLCFQDGRGDASRIREQSGELSILTMYDAQVGHLSLNDDGFIFVMTHILSLYQLLNGIFPADSTIIGRVYILRSSFYLPSLYYE